MKYIRDAKVIDLFCGVGGLTHGLIQSGLEVVAGFDIDESCRYAYEENNKAKFINKDIREVTATELNELYGDAKYKILVGCAPCQPFSSHSNKNRDKNFSNCDQRWKLLYEFIRIIKSTLPDVISMENVPQLTKFSVFDDFVDELNNLSYNVHYGVVDCSNIGLPQTRKRLALVAFKNDNGLIQFPIFGESRKKTVRDAIHELEPIKHGGVFFKDKIHRAAKLSELNLERIKTSKPGKSWKDWPQELLPQCYKKESGQSFSSVYGRMEWDKPAPTITTQFHTYGTGRFGHPEQDRAISLREGAILQGFPDNYKFIDSTKSDHINTKIIARQIGNAVPPILGNMLGNVIIQKLSESIHV